MQIVGVGTGYALRGSIFVTGFAVGGCAKETPQVIVVFVVGVWTWLESRRKIKKL